MLELIDEAKRARHEEEVAKIANAEYLRREIMVLRELVPKAAMGAKHSKTQSKRRADKPATDSYTDPNRNARLRDFHARLTEDGQKDATAQTAVEFEIGKRQVPQDFLRKG